MLMMVVDGQPRGNMRTSPKYVSWIQSKVWSDYQGIPAAASCAWSMGTKGEVQVELVGLACTCSGGRRATGDLSGFGLAEMRMSGLEGCPVCALRERCRSLSVATFAGGRVFSP